MLLIHPDCEERLAQTRAFMDELDKAMYVLDVYPLCRKSLENKLEYLRKYACNNNGIDQFKSCCFLFSDVYPTSFQFSIRSHPVECIGKRYMTYGDMLDFYNHSVISGGLIWHGPKSVQEYADLEDKQLLYVWETHT